MLKFNRKNNFLGVSHERQRYDLPLDKDGGAIFLKILIVLMTFLAILALSGSYVLSAMKDRWSSGLDNKASIEISAQNIEGGVLTSEQIQESTNNVFQFVKSHPAVENVVIMQDEDIAALIAPWIGDNIAFDQIPMPGIMTVNFKKNVEFDSATFEQNLKTISPQARLDTHESWLKDVLRFTGALKFAAILVTTLIGLITFISIAGAVKTRMEVYHEELELLHLMGAADNYIAEQLQRYIFIACLQAAVIGAVIGIVILCLIHITSGQMNMGLLPDFSLSGGQKISFLLLPLLIAFLGAITARHTVLRVLRQMP
jgi:cell division transport system permease protein